MPTIRNLILGVPLILLADPTLAATAIDESLPMAPSGLADLEFTNATVHITAGSDSEFHIVGELSEFAEHYELRENNGNIHFEEDPDGRGNARGRYGWLWDWDDCEEEEDCRNGNRVSNIEISIPAGAVLRLENLNGEIHIENLSNSVNVSSVNGDLILQNIRGTVKAETVNGSIDSTGMQGKVSLETVNGHISDNDSKASRIDYSTVNGDIESNVDSQDISAETVNGDMELEFAVVHELELTTVGGRIDVDTTLADGADIDISGVNGRVNLTVPDSSSATFLINTEVSGRISNQLTDDEPVRESRYVNASNLSFSMNQGKAHVEITTVSGNITLRKK